MKSKMLERYFKKVMNPNWHMKMKYPKAAKKKRIVKKWLKRFGPDTSDMVRQAYKASEKFFTENFYGIKDVHKWN